MFVMLICSSFSAAAAGPLTIKGDQCECAEAKSTEPTIILSDKLGYGNTGAKWGRDRELSEHGQTYK